MSTNIGDELKATDLINWYTILNDTINIGGNQGQWETSGGTVISSIAVPSSASLQGTDIYASQIYAITDRINQLLTDEYIKTQPGLYSSYNSALYSTTATVTYAVRAGCIIYTNALTPFLTTINNWKTSVKCRNLATYTYGSYSCGSYSSTKRNYTTCTNGTNQCGTNAKGNYSSTSRQNGTNSNSTRQNGTQSNTTNTVCCNTCRAYIPVQCASATFSSNCSSGTCNHFTMGSGSFSHGTWAHGQYSCGNYGSGSKVHTDCSSGTNSHQYYKNGNYSSTSCTSGSKKDILCNCTTYKHG